MPFIQLPPISKANRVYFANRGFNSQVLSGAAGMPLAHTNHRLAWMESLTERALARAAPLRFEVTQSRHDLERIYRFRREIVIEKGWVRADDIGPVGDQDSYDDFAVHIAGWHNRVLVASSRLVLPRPGVPLPTEAVFGLRVATAGVADVGRVAVACGYRGSGHRVLWALLCKSWLEMRARGFTVALTILTAAVQRLYSGWGLDVETLAPPREYWGEIRYPALVRPASSLRGKVLQTMRRAELNQSGIIDVAGKKAGNE
jgi:predicted GNAT family N-acyltransferase